MSKSVLDLSGLWDTEFKGSSLKMVSFMPTVTTELNVMRRASHRGTTGQGELCVAFPRQEEGVGVHRAACRRFLTGPATSQLSMLFTEECDRVRDLMHVHSFSYDFHLRLVRQHVLGAHAVLRHGYHLTTFLRHFLAHHPDGPHFGRNHIYQGQCPRASQ